MPTDFTARQSDLSEPTNYYELLQVSPKADPEIIEAAYRRLALKFHPDHNPLPQATAKMQALNEAYNILKDPQRRAEYDQELNRPNHDDLTDDDYTPPPRRVSWLARLGRSEWAARLGWLAVVGLLVGLIVFWLGQHEAGPISAAGPTPVAALPTVSLPEGTLFWDDLESVAGANWLLDAPWHLTTRYAHSGKFSLWFGDESRGRYGPNLSAAATVVRPIGLPKEGKPVMTFWLAGQSDRDEMSTGEDRLFVELARPGQDFQTIFTANGLYPGWQQITLDLSRWKGQPVLFRFRFSSGLLNSGAGFSGFFVDDVKVGF